MLEEILNILWEESKRISLVHKATKLFQHPTMWKGRKCWIAMASKSECTLLFLPFEKYCVISILCTSEVACVISVSPILAVRLEKIGNRMALFLYVFWNNKQQKEALASVLFSVQEQGKKCCPRPQIIQSATCTLFSNVVSATSVS